MWIDGVYQHPAVGMPVVGRFGESWTSEFAPLWFKEEHDGDRYYDGDTVRPELQTAHAWFIKKLNGETCRERSYIWTTNKGLLCDGGFCGAWGSTFLPAVESMGSGRHLAREFKSGTSAGDGRGYNLTYWVACGLNSTFDIRATAA